MSPRSSAKLTADVSVRPARSQVVLVGFIVLSGLSMLISAGMLILGSAEGWGFFAFSIVVSLLAAYGWFAAQSDTDLDQAEPTSFALANGTKVSTDTRLLRSEEGIAAIIRAAQGVLHRRPLPEPDGILGQDFAVIQGSKQAAKELVDSINAETQKLTNDLGSALGLSCDCPHELQEITAESQTAPVTGIQ